MIQLRYVMMIYVLILYGSYLDIFDDAIKKSLQEWFVPVDHVSSCLLCQSTF